MAKFIIGENVIYRGLVYRYGGYCREKRMFYLDSPRTLTFVLAEPSQVKRIDLFSNYGY